jgi:hypothetical protein
LLRLSLRFAHKIPTHTDNVRGSAFCQIIEKTQGFSLKTPDLPLIGT